MNDFHPRLVILYIFGFFITLVVGLAGMIAGFWIGETTGGALGIVSGLLIGAVAGYKISRSIGDRIYGKDQLLPGKETGCLTILAATMGVFLGGTIAFFLCMFIGGKALGEAVPLVIMSSAILFGYLGGNMAERWTKK